MRGAHEQLDRLSGQEPSLPKQPTKAAQCTLNCSVLESSFEGLQARSCTYPIAVQARCRLQCPATKKTVRYRCISDKQEGNVTIVEVGLLRSDRWYYAGLGEV